MKAKVYIETSVISYLTARPNNDIRAMANQNVTIEWWETQRSNYDVFISEFVIAEASLGHPDAISRRIAAISDIMELQATEEVRTLGQELIRRHALPTNAEIDAYHVAIATVNGMEYLLTWRCPWRAGTCPDRAGSRPRSHTARTRRGDRRGRAP